MNDLPALITSITALVTALGGLIALFRHVGKPAIAAHPTPLVVVPEAYTGNQAGTTVVEAPAEPPPAV